MYVDGKGNVFVSDDGGGPGHWRGAKPAGGKHFPGGAVSDFFPIPRVCDGCGSAEPPAAAAAAALPVLWKKYNSSDLACGDLPGSDRKFPKNTSDAAGIALCQALCAAHAAACGGYVFVSGNAGTPTPGGPRCAIKLAKCCPGRARGGCYAGLRPAACAHPRPPPGPPRPHPPPPPTGPPTHVHEGGDAYQLVMYTEGTAKDEAGIVAASSHATVAAAASLGFKAKCDQVSNAFRRSCSPPSDEHSRRNRVWSASPRASSTR